MSEDILTVAQRRRAARPLNMVDTPLMNDMGMSFKDSRGARRQSFPSERILRIDNYTTGPETPSPVPSPQPRFSPKFQRFESKGFVAEMADMERKRVPTRGGAAPIFTNDVPFSRNILPPLISVQIQGEDIPSLVNTSSHISLISSKLMNNLGLRKEFIPDTTVPPSPLHLGSTNTPYLVEGKLRYVELVVNGSKHVTQLYVARDLPADLILGVDFLKKAQVKINFQDSSLTLPAGSVEVKVSFLSSKELQNKKQFTTLPGSVEIIGMRANSSNF